VDITSRKGVKKGHGSRLERYSTALEPPKEAKTGQNQANGGVEKTPEPTRALKLASNAATDVARADGRKDPRAHTGTETVTHHLICAVRFELLVEKTPEPTRALKHA
jgi:hypothetical protein